MSPEDPVDTELAPSHNDATANASARDRSATAARGRGIAGRIAAFFINSPLTPLLLLATLGIGILGLLITPRQEDPDISVPMVDIKLRYPGASSGQVARLAVEPLERLMSELSDVEHVYSVSRREEALVTVRFEVGTAIEPAVVAVHDTIESNLDKVPPDLTEWLVQPKTIDDVPVLTLTLWSEEIDDARLRMLGLQLLQTLKQVENTGNGFVVGGRQHEIGIEPQPEQLRGYGISLDQLAETVRGANAGRGTGSVEQGATAAVAVLSLIAIGVRPALIVLAVIPVVILMTVWSAGAVGFTINRVSLFALIFAIGILVDDATVVVENIFRRWLADGATAKAVAIEAVGEVGNPTILATLTVLAALLPMGFVTGMMGPYMRPIPILGSVAMVFSLFAAFVFTPWLAYRLRPKLAALERSAKRERRLQDWIDRGYRPLIEVLIEQRAVRWPFLVGILIAFIVAVMMLPLQACARWDTSPQAWRGRSAHRSTA